MNLSINAIGRPPTATSEPSPAAAPARVSSASSSTAAPSDDKFKQPTPPRFPWLSRLAQQLETASNQRAAFPPAPVLGDNLDKSA